MKIRALKRKLHALLKNVFKHCIDSPQHKDMLTNVKHNNAQRRDFNVKKHCFWRCLQISYIHVREALADRARMEVVRV